MHDWRRNPWVYVPLVIVTAMAWAVLVAFSLATWIRLLRLAW